MKDLFLERVTANIDVLMSVKRGLREKQPEALQSVRRIAWALDHSGEQHGFSTICEAAKALIKASESDVTEKLDCLIAALKNILSNHSEEKLGILVIDDNKDVGLILKARFSREGRPVYTAETGAAALETLTYHRVGLILLDLYLPDTDGRNLLVDLRSRSDTAHLPVIVLSAKSATETKAECFALGADDYVEKPFDIITLSAEISAKLRNVAQRERETSRQDSVTGLLNRDAFRKAFQQIQEQQPLQKPSHFSGLARKKYPRLFTEDSHLSTSINNSSIVAVDMDSFQQILNQYGQEISEKCLKYIAHFFKAKLRHSDILTRWDNDEFVILLPQTPIDETVNVLENLQKELKFISLPTPQVVQPTFSAGVFAVHPKISVEVAIEAAKELLTIAKNRGGNCIVSSKNGQSNQSQKILLIEEDELIAAFIKHRLEKEKLEVLHFTDGITVLEQVIEHSFAFIILDIDLPDIDGLTVLERIRQLPKYSRIPILLLLPKGHEQDILRGFQLGADDYLEKPFSPVELVARIHNLLK